MVTPEQLREFIGRRPFKPFRIVLTDGQLLDVTRTQQAVAMKTKMIYITPEDRLRWIQLATIDRVESLESLAG